MSARVAVCTDSGAQLSDEMTQGARVHVVPLTVMVDGVEYAEDEHLDREWFYGRLGLAEPSAVSTSQPSPGAFVEAYEQLAADGATAIVSIHADGRVSGTVESARLAAASATVPVVVVDTGTVSFGVAVCALEARRALGRNLSPEEAGALAQRLGSRIKTAFVAPGASGGRVPETAGTTILTFSDAKAHPVGAEVEPQAVPAAIASLVERSVRVEAAVGHASARSRESADELARLLEEMDVVVSVRRYRAGPSVAAHAGPDTYGAFWWAAEVAA